MKLRPPTVDVPPGNPFANDLLDRKATADFLTEIIRSSDASLVIAIDAPWGSGKSTFLQMWASQLVLDGAPVISINAWESDFSEDAFISMMGEFELGMIPLQPNDKSAAQQALDRAKRIGVKIAKRVLPTAVKVATAGLIDADEIVETALAEATEKAALDRINDYEETRRSISGFRNALEEFAAQLEEDFPLVVIVDELDRCKPSYAIDVLENIKHLFSVPKIVFVICADWKQLSNVVRHRYGLDTDAEGYLRRFIDLSFVLPSPKDEKFLHAQFDRFGLADFFKQRTGQYSRYELEQFKELFHFLFREAACTPRDQERCFAILSLAIRATAPNSRLFPFLLAPLIVLKVANPDLYKKYTLREVSASEVVRYFSRTQSGKEFFLETRGYSPSLEAYLIQGQADSWRDETHIEVLKSRLNDKDLSTEMKSRVEAILEILTSFEMRETHGLMSYLTKKIDFVSSASP